MIRVGRGNIQVTCTAALLGGVGTITDVTLAEAQRFEGQLAKLNATCRLCSPDDRDRRVVENFVLARPNRACAWETGLCLIVEWFARQGVGSQTKTNRVTLCFAPPQFFLIEPRRTSAMVPIAD
jgi:hypothetical protein